VGYTEALNAKGIEGGTRRGTSFGVGDGGGNWLSKTRTGGSGCLGTRGAAQDSPVAARAV
jgi:hypothetical protein